MPTTAKPRPQSPAATETILRLLVQSGLVASWSEAAELQRASLAVCEACRGCIPAKLRVVKETPSYLWAHDDRKTHGREGGETNSRGNNGEGGENSRDRYTGGNGGCSGSGGGRNRATDDTGGAISSNSASRLPPLQISSLVWERPAIQLGDGSLLPAGLRDLTFGREFNKKLDGFRWPPKLERVTFGSKFNRDIAGAGARARAGAGVACKLPDSLVELTFGKQFNKPLPERLPAALVHLTLGRNFCRSLRAVVWPSGLKVVKFGEAMLGRPPSESRLESALGLAWPASLDRVEFCANGRAVAILRGGKVEWDRDGSDERSDLGAG